MFGCPFETDPSSLLSDLRTFPSFLLTFQKRMFLHRMDVMEWRVVAVSNHIQHALGLYPHRGGVQQTLQYNWPGQF